MWTINQLDVKFSTFFLESYGTFSGEKKKHIVGHKTTLHTLKGIYHAMCFLSWRPKYVLSQHNYIKIGDLNLFEKLSNIWPFMTINLVNNKLQEKLENILNAIKMKNIYIYVYIYTHTHTHTHTHIYANKLDNVEEMD